MKAADKTINEVKLTVVIPVEYKSFTKNLHFISFNKKGLTRTDLHKHIKYVGIHSYQTMTLLDFINYLGLIYQDIDRMIEI